MGQVRRSRSPRPWQHPLVTSSLRTIAICAASLLVVAGTSVSWLQGAHNQALGGPSYDTDVRFDVAMALLAPVAAVAAWMEYRHRDRSALKAFRAASGRRDRVGLDMVRTRCKVGADLSASFAFSRKYGRVGARLSR